MLVIVPPQTFCEITEKLGWSGGVTEFYRLYVTGFDGWRPGGRHLVVPTWNHLWFVPYLWVYTKIVIAARPLLVDRQGVGQGKSVSVRVEFGGRRIIKNKKADEHHTVTK